MADDSSDPGWRTVAAISEHAVNRCAPFDYFPAENYQDWKGLLVGYRLSANLSEAADGIVVGLHSELIVDPETAQALDQGLQRLSACWANSMRQFVGEPTLISVAFSLDRSGALTGEPRVLEIHGSQDLDLRDFLAGSAVESIRTCAPFDKLPADRYAEWKEAIVHLQVNVRTPD
jgi:hypothetical protein